MRHFDEYEQFLYTNLELKVGYGTEQLGVVSVSSREWIIWFDDKHKKTIITLPTFESNLKISFLAFNALSMFLDSKPWITNTFV